MIKKKSLNQEDKNTWENYIKDPSDVYDKEKGFPKNKKRKERFKFDLHGFTLEGANKKIKEILQHCVDNHYKELLIITGKGIHSTNDQDAFTSRDFGKLKYSIPDYIKSNEELNKLVISINNAQKEDGGEGALLLKLKNLQNKF